ncbi:Bro-N domain-containing protein [Microbulbifer sp. SSSA002]|uniref:BRO-N domain-containing protein n=1 Tax=Microbulbifer sp. SSSA002 TaxID=3243376 RepID=UPI0040399E0D
MGNVIPFNFKSRQVRVVEQNGEPWFVAKDVAEVLGYKRTADAVRAHCKGVGEMQTPINGVIQTVKIIPESDVYRLIFRSKLPEAEAFEDLVVKEILPSIRKTGQYNSTKPEMSGDKLLIVANRSFGAAHGLAKRMGMKGNQAILLANRVVEETTGISPMKLMGVTHLEAENNEPLYTPSELGKAYEMSGQQFNTILQGMGLQKRVEYKPKQKRWELLPKGEEFGRYCDTGKNHSSGAPVQQIKWRKAVLEEVARYAEQLRDKLPGGPSLKVV